MFANLADWVEDRTGNRRLAAIADWFVGRPLTIVLIAVVAFVLATLAKKVIRAAMTRVGSSRPVLDPRRTARATAIAGVVTSAAAIAIWLVASFLIVGELGIDLAPLLASAGIAGVALGFGAQSLVRDWLSGLFMIIEDQFGVGDSVDLGEAAGVVERISLRATVVRGVDGTVWHVPNGEVRRVGNRSQLWSVAIVDIEVPHEAPLDVVKTAVVETASAVCADEAIAAKVLEAPQLLGVESVTVDAVTLRVLVKTTPGDQWGLQRELREAIKSRLDELGVGVPLPGRALWSRLAAQRPTGDDETG